MTVGTASMENNSRLIGTNFKLAVLHFTLMLTVLVIPGGCARRGPEAETPHPRLVTFSPALTRIVFDAGLGEHVVGVTTFCRVPRGQSRPVVGDNLNVRVEPILAVRPDVLLVQMEVRHFEPLHRVRPDIRIEHFSIETLTDIASAMERIGKLVGKPRLGLQQGRLFRQRLGALRRRTEKLPRRRVMFVMGYRNPSGPGKGTFMDEMINLAGGVNVLAERFDSWKRPGLEAVIKLAPELIICQCKPGRETEAVAYWKALKYPNNSVKRVVTVTDDDWTVPAGHLAEYAERLAGFIHPELQIRQVRPDLPTGRQAGQAGLSAAAGKSGSNVKEQKGKSPR